MHSLKNATPTSDNFLNFRDEIKMIKASYYRYLLKFKEPAKTSRQTMTVKETFFIRLQDEGSPSVFGLGEAALFRGLSSDDQPDYEQRLAELCGRINDGTIRLTDEGDGRLSAGAYRHPYSSIQFGLECALRDLNIRNGHILPSELPWERGESAITINGLVWMGDSEQMLRRINDKLSQGFKCVKLKIGGIDFNDELRLLSYIRGSFDSDTLTVRLDANGAFTAENAMPRLEALSRFGIHSIEQPIKSGQWDAMGEICRQSPIPIALDEELIGSFDTDTMRRMLDTIRPQMIILKPSLCGGLDNARRWCEEADRRGIGWWYTSALESNIGLNAIAREVSRLAHEGNPCASWPQGLGTGALYTNNIPYPLALQADRLSLRRQII